MLHWVSLGTPPPVWQKRTLSIDVLMYKWAAVMDTPSTMARVTLLHAAPRRFCLQGESLSPSSLISRLLLALSSGQRSHQTQASCQPQLSNPLICHHQLRSKPDPLGNTSLTQVLGPQFWLHGSLSTPKLQSTQPVISPRHTEALHSQSTPAESTKPALGSVSLTNGVIPPTLLRRQVSLDGTHVISGATEAKPVAVPR